MSIYQLACIVEKQNGLNESGSESASVKPKQIEFNYATLGYKILIYTIEGHSINSR